jgi:hypothetical protein
MFRVHTPIIRNIRCWVAGWRRTSHGTIRTVHTTYAAALKTTTHLKSWRRKPYDATKHLMLLMMGVCTRNMSSKEYINKITLLHQVGISHYFRCSFLHSLFWQLNDTDLSPSVSKYGRHFPSPTFFLISLNFQNANNHSWMQYKILAFWGCYVT